MHEQLGKFWTTRYKKKKKKTHTKKQLPLLKCQEQKQGTAHNLCTQHYLMGGQTI